MPKILFWNHSINIGGAEKSLLEILKFLDREYFSPIVAGSAHGQFLEAVEGLGIRTEVISLSPFVLKLSRKEKFSIWRASVSLIFSLKTVFLAAKLIRTEKIGIIYANSLKTDILAAGVGVLTGSRVVWHIRDILPEGVLKRAFIFLGERFADKIIVNSDFTMSQFSGSPQFLKKTRRIYSGIGLAEFKPQTRVNSISGKDLTNFNSIVGIFSMLTPWKGHRCFIDAAELVIKERPNTLFLITGENIYETASADTGYREELEGLVKSKGIENNFLFTGYRHDPQSLINVCDVVVSASVEPEPFGRTIVEAMACEKPVIAPRCGGYLETVVENKTGIYFASGNRVELAKGILYLLADPGLRQKMGQDGRKIAEEKFDSRVLIKDIEGIFQDTLAQQLDEPADLRYIRRVALRWVNNLFGKAVCLLFKNLIFSRQSQKSREFKKIICIKIVGLGDAVLLLPAIKAYKEIFPEASISVLTSQELAEVFRGLSFIDELIIYDLFGRESGFLSFFKLIKKLRDKGFDCCVDFEQHLYLTTILSFLSRIPRRIGFSHPLHRRDYLLTRAFRFDDQKHMADTFFDLVRVFAPNRQLDKLERLSIGAVDREYIEGIFNKNNITDRDFIIGIHAGTGKRARMRQWPKERFALLADRLVAEFKAKIVFTGALSDTGLVKSITGLMKERPLNLAGKTDLKQTAALIERLALFISNDTGPMHLGPAMGTPTVGLFGPNTPLRYGPFGKEHLALYSAPACSPCINIHLARVKACRKAVCMEQLGVDDVFAQVSKKIRGLNKEKTFFADGSGQKNI